MAIKHTNKPKNTNNKLKIHHRHNVFQRITVQKTLKLTKRMNEPNKRNNMMNKNNNKHNKSDTN